MRKTTTAPAHTPVPWKVTPDLRIWQFEADPANRGHEHLVALIARDEIVPLRTRKANARFIVTACNSHEDLMAACKEAFRTLDESIRGIATEDEKRSTMKILQSAYAKAEGR